MLKLFFNFVVFLFLFKLYGCSESDSCMDRGGCWDRVDQICRIEETNAQELCNR